eukprot:TRINITY_DN5388_c0_g1_i1.p1 TRINITY_DN5388_c0_g1~~TRINITY_DN5388_c0_g1_i1.p1  ORF type:complete len:410 (-),score=105.84 TRINITY_DN5388_c0_g1_i1:425-1654(-)
MSKESFKIEEKQLSPLHSTILIDENVTRRINSANDSNNFRENEENIENEFFKSHKLEVNSTLPYLSNPKESIHLLGFLDLSGLSFKWQFAVCVLGIFGCALPYGIVQEKLWLVEGFKFSFYATFLQYFLYLTFGYIERTATGDTKTRATWKDYVKLAGFMVISLFLSNTALTYLSYPTKVLFKSSKIIPLMMIGRFAFGKKYTLIQYSASVFLLSGVILFSLADAKTSSTSTSVGILLMSVSIGCEALGQNFQDEVIGRCGCTEPEMLYYQGVVGSVMMGCFLLVTGEFFTAFWFCFEHPQVYLLATGLALLGYLNNIFALAVTRTCGVFVTATVGTCRKLFTIILSFLVFPKPFLYTYLIAGSLAFFGIGLNIYAKNEKQSRELIFKVKHMLFSSNKKGYNQVGVSEL